MVNQLEHEYKHKKFIRAKRNIPISNRSIGTGTSPFETALQISPQNTQSTNQETNTNIDILDQNTINNEVVRNIINEMTNNIISSNTFIV